MRASARPERHAAGAPGRRYRISPVLTRAWAVATFALVCAASRSEAAEPAPPITVEREPGSEDCPDTSALVVQVEAILGRRSVPEMTPYHVAFSRTAEAFSAAIRSAEGGATVRRLEAQEPSCAALAHATAVALALLYDSDLGGAGDLPAPALPPEVSKPPVAPAVPLATPKMEASRLRVAPIFSAGAAALVGVLRPVAPAFVGDAGLEIGNFRASLGALWVPPQTLSLSPGTVHEDLISGTLRACYVAWRSTAMRFDLCTGALVGALSAEARGFTVNEHDTQLFLAFPVEVALAVRTGIVGWELGASALVLSPPNEFRVEGRGLAYSPALVAGMFALRVVLEPLALPLQDGTSTR
jgi:hypothetical protein